MSYCRLSDPVPELTPEVDLSFEKTMELIAQGYEVYKKYKEDNGVINSDAYVWESCHGGFVCDWAKSTGNTTASFDSAIEMAEYLTEMKAKGFNIPQLAIDALFEEAEYVEERQKIEQIKKLAEETEISWYDLTCAATDEQLLKFVELIEQKCWQEFCEDQIDEDDIL